MMGNEAISEGMRPWATGGATGGLHAGLLSLYLLLTLKLLWARRGCAWGEKVNMNKSMGELAPTWTTGTHKANWSHLPLSLNNSSRNTGLRCRRSWCPSPRG